MIIMIAFNHFSGINSAQLLTYTGNQQANLFTSTSFSSTLAAVFLDSVISRACMLANGMYTGIHIDHLEIKNPDVKSFIFDRSPVVYICWLVCHIVLLVARQIPRFDSTHYLVLDTLHAKYKLSIIFELANYGKQRS